MEEGQQTRISGEDIVCPSCYLLVQDAKDGSHDVPFVVDTSCLLDPCTDFQ